MKKHSYEGPLTVDYRLQPCWYDHEFTGLPYEVEKLVEALDAIGGKVFRIWYIKEERGACGHVVSRVHADVTSEYYPVPVPEF
jgi:hypothetical protein